MTRRLQPLPLGRAARLAGLENLPAQPASLSTQRVDLVDCLDNRTQLVGYLALREQLSQLMPRLSYSSRPGPSVRRSMTPDNDGQYP